MLLLFLRAHEQMQSFCFHRQTLAPSHDLEAPMITVRTQRKFNTAVPSNCAIDEAEQSHVSISDSDLGNF